MKLGDGMTDRLQTCILVIAAIIGVAAMIFALSTYSHAFPRPDNPAPHARKHK